LHHELGTFKPLKDESGHASFRLDASPSYVAQCKPSINHSFTHHSPRPQYRERVDDSYWMEYQQITINQITST